MEEGKEGGDLRRPIAFGALHPSEGRAEAGVEAPDEGGVGVGEVRRQLAEETGGE